MSIVRHLVIAACLLSLLFGPNSVLADHEDHHGIELPVLPQPLPSPPPPNISDTHTLPQLDSCHHNSLIPTDSSGIGGSLGRVQGLKQKINCTCNHIAGKHTHPAAKIPVDPRYQFVGRWYSWPKGSSTEETHLATSSHTTGSAPHVGHIVHSVSISRHGEVKGAVFMPTSGAKFLRNEEHGLSLSQGTLLVKAAAEPVTISMVVQGKKVTAQVGGCAIAMVSLLDGHPMVLNLTDKCCGACTVTIGANGRTVVAAAGQVLEVFASGTQPQSTAVASKVLLKQELGDGLAMQVSWHHYVTALTRYNLCKCLPKPDINRVLKTAAALLYTCKQ